MRGGKSVAYEIEPFTGLGDEEVKEYICKPPRKNCTDGIMNIKK